MSSLDQIREQLEDYKRRYYKRKSIIGFSAFAIISFGILFLFALLEYQFWMNSAARGILFFLFLSISIGSFIALFLIPFLKLLRVQKGINNEAAAYEISKYIPEIEDKLLNLLQLGSQSSGDNDLITAAIERKAQELKQFSFSKAIDFSKAKKYAVGFGVVLLCFLLVSFVNPEIVNDSSKRIANYSTEFERESPFTFTLLNQSLEAFKGESFTVSFEVSGEFLPENVALIIDGEITKSLKGDEEEVYSYTFDRIQKDKSIQLSASGFLSKRYSIEALSRPDLLSMDITTISPRYTGGERQVISNTGDITVLEGSQIKWSINALATEEATILLAADSLSFQRSTENEFLVESRVYDSQEYKILLQNKVSDNKSDLIYNIEVIKDLFPKITAEFFPDSSSYQFITVAGSIVDDYGFSKLNINYRSDVSNSFRQIPLAFNKTNASQSFYANWDIDSLNLVAGSNLEVFISVSDNDNINGNKTSRSKTFIFQIPTEDEIESILSEKSNDVENKLNDSKKDVEEIADRLSDLEDRLKTEQKFDWQEQKILEDVIKDRELLNKELTELQKKHQQLQKTTNQFNKQSQQMQKKNDQLQELLEQLMDEETKKLYEKLKELMRENAPKDQISEQLQQLQRNEKNLEKEMDRALELFKRLKMESALEQNLQKLDTLSSKQENASQEEELSSSQKQQEKIAEEFNEFREKMDEVMEMNQDLKRPEAMEDFEYEERQIAKELREIQEEMEELSQSEKSDPSDSSNENQEEKPDQGNQPKENSKKNLQQKQQNAAKKMKNLSQKLSKMQGGMQMEMMQANLDQLRDILDNLIKLSFSQEDIMSEMKQVNQSDPRFLELSQNQIKLKDDAKVIQDSLLSLASKVVQISSFVTREVDQINVSIDEALDYLKDRNRGRALSSQQFAMTSINNLALLLDDTMQQMQMAMSEAMGNGSEQKQEQQGIPDMQELQNQLGQKIDELKGSGKSGRELSEELARLAAEQEMIRQQLEMLKEAEEGRPGGGKAGDELQKAIDMMEQNEIDLVNKRLTEQLLFRQKQIQTRLLEADKAKREQETEEEREADRPSIITREIPPEFEEYLRLKKKEIELLKTIPIELNPFYKKEVNDYFRRISTEQEE